MWQQKLSIIIFYQK